MKLRLPFLFSNFLSYVTFSLVIVHNVIRVLLEETVMFVLLILPTGSRACLSICSSLLCPQENDGDSCIRPLGRPFDLFPGLSEVQILLYMRSFPLEFVTGMLLAHWKGPDVSSISPPFSGPVLFLFI